MKKEQAPYTEATLGGVEGFIAAIETMAARATPGRAGRRAFIRELGAECAYIRLEDMRHPLRFLRQMAGQPPLRFGVRGFNPALVDDSNPARHYSAFVLVGYWLPGALALLFLYGWEIAGFFRYGGVWSANDMRSGKIGLRHGRAVQRQGPDILPQLVRRDLAAPRPPV